MVMLGLSAAIPMRAAGADAARAARPMAERCGTLQLEGQRGRLAFLSLLPGTNRLKTQRRRSSLKA